jgi:Pentapeptide repeats (9 copies)
VINRHVTEEAKVSWAANDFDFTRAQLRDFILERCTFAGRVTFAEAEFTGECTFDDVAFEGGASFTACAMHDHMKLDDVRAGGRHELTFAGARIGHDAELEIIPNTKDPKKFTRMLNFTSMVVLGKLTIRHTDSVFRQPPLDLDRMKLEGGCVEVISTLSLTKDPRPRYPYKLITRDWEISPGSRILIPQKFINDDTVNWRRRDNPTAVPDDVEITFKVPPTTDF